MPLSLPDRACVDDAGCHSKSYRACMMSHTISRNKYGPSQARCRRVHTAHSSASKHRHYSLLQDTYQCLTSIHTTQPHSKTSLSLRNHNMSLWPSSNPVPCKLTCETSLASAVARESVCSSFVAQQPFWHVCRPMSNHDMGLLLTASLLSALHGVTACTLHSFCRHLWVHHHHGVRGT